MHGETPEIPRAAQPAGEEPELVNPPVETLAPLGDEAGE